MPFDNQARVLDETITDWPLWDALIPGEKNVININLGPPENVLLAPLHIKCDS